MSKKPLIIANWKMHGHTAGGLLLAKAIVVGITKMDADVVLCPPFTLISEIRSAIKISSLKLGAQDCSHEPEGAFTGDISALMLKDLGCSHVIVGHSERRHHHKETDILVAAKAKAAHNAGLITVICVGESADDKASGQTLQVIDRQLAASIPNTATRANTVIGYEPVWAIGSGKTPSLEEIEAVHKYIQNRLVALPGISVIYGGSVKPSNAKDILALPSTDGLLVGGASLNAESFIALVETAAKS